MSSNSPSPNSPLVFSPPAPSTSPPPNPPADVTLSPPSPSTPPTSSPPEFVSSSKPRANASHPLSPPPQHSKPPPKSHPPPPAKSPHAPPPTDPPPNSPPPPPPNNSPPPPAKKPPESSPPPIQPPKINPSPPKPLESSPPPPLSNPPPSSPFFPPTITNAPLSRSLPSPSSHPKSSPPPSPPPIRTSPPPPSVLSPTSHSHPSPSIVSPGAPSTNGSSSNATRNSQSGNGGIGTGGTVAVVLVIGLLFLSIFGAVAFCVWKRKKKGSGSNGGYIMPASLGSSQEAGPDSALLKVQPLAPKNGIGSGKGFVYSPRTPGGLGKLGSFGYTKSCFTYEELVEATDDFSAQNLLGEGGFGLVYKGSLADGRDVAVKQLNIGGGQGDREFRSEVEIISRIHHRHLVSLVGYCIYENRRLLVYDYVPNNNLYFHLHSEGRPALDWATRVKIAIGAARGIAYLHEDCHPRIIHRDIKSSNILLDNNFDARVSDFGLAKLAMDANTHITTRVMGTIGYMAPEYASSGKLTEKSDVFSYGVVLLELITGRKPVDSSQPLGDESLVEWVSNIVHYTELLLSSAWQKVEVLLFLPWNSWLKLFIHKSK